MNNNTTKKYLLGLLDKSEFELEAEKEEDEEDNFPSYLENKTAISIQKEISDVCFRENIPQNIVEKLTEYRYVDKICDLIRGKYIRWVRLSKDKGDLTLTKGDLTLTKGDLTLTKGNLTLTKGDLTLTKGGIVADIKFLENGIYILIKNACNKFIQYRFDECITFQKLSVEELLYINIC